MPTITITGDTTQEALEDVLYQGIAKYGKDFNVKISPNLRFENQNREIEKSRIGWVKQKDIPDFICSRCDKKTSEINGICEDCVEDVVKGRIELYKSDLCKEIDKVRLDTNVWISNTRFNQGLEKAKEILDRISKPSAKLKTKEIVNRK